MLQRLQEGHEFRKLEYGFSAEIDQIENILAPEKGSKLLPVPIRKDVAELIMPCAPADFGDELARGCRDF